MGLKATWLKPSKRMIAGLSAAALLTTGIGILMPSAEASADTDADYLTACPPNSSKAIRTCFEDPTLQKAIALSFGHKTVSSTLSMQYRNMSKAASGNRSGQTGELLRPRDNNAPGKLNFSILDAEIKKWWIPKEDRYDILSLNGIGNMTGLRIFDISNNPEIGGRGAPFSDYSPLANLQNLEDLSVDNNYLGANALQLSSADNDAPPKHPQSRQQAVDLSSFAGISKLKSFSAKNNYLTDSDLATLAGLDSFDKSHFNSLNVDNNLISSLAPLKNLNSLTSLHFDNNRVYDMSDIPNPENIADFSGAEQVIDLGEIGLAHVPISVKNAKVSDGEYAGIPIVSLSPNFSDRTYSYNPNTGDLHWEDPEAGNYEFMFYYDFGNNRIFSGNVKFSLRDVRRVSFIDKNAPQNINPVHEDITAGARLTAGQIPQRESTVDADFEGWYIEDIANKGNPNFSAGLQSVSDMIGHNIFDNETYVGYWKPMPQLQTHLQDGSLGPSYQTKRTSPGTGKLIPSQSVPNPELEHKIFDKWVDAHGNPVDMADLPLVEDTNKHEYKAIDIYPTYIDLPKVIYDYNQGHGSPADDYTKLDAGVIKLAALENKSAQRDGYEFLGWTYDLNGTEPVDFTNIQHVSSGSGYQNVTVHARWAKLPDVHFDYNGGAGTVSQLGTKASAGKVALKEDLPTPNLRAGYHFMGWVYDVHNPSPVDASDLTHIGSSPNYQDVTVYAKWMKLPKLLLDEKGDGTFQASSIAVEVDAQGQNPHLASEPTDPQSPS